MNEGTWACGLQVFVRIGHRGRWDSGFLGKGEHMSKIRDKRYDEQWEYHALYGRRMSPVRHPFAKHAAMPRSLGIWSAGIGDSEPSGCTLALHNPHIITIAVGLNVKRWASFPLRRRWARKVLKHRLRAKQTTLLSTSSLFKIVFPVRLLKPLPPCYPGPECCQ